jgi:hypothetical protein
VTTLDPFRWEVNDEDEARAACRCGWLGPWRDRLRDAHDDEDGHNCELVKAWEAEK